MNKIKKIINDYNQEDKKSFFLLKFLSKISKSKVYVSFTGLVCHFPNFDTDTNLNLWSNRIFKKKLKVKYSSSDPIMKSRHYFVALFVEKFLKKNFSFCDFGTGEGNFLIELNRIRPDGKFFFTEHSKLYFKNIINFFKKSYKKKIFGYNGSIENFNKNKLVKSIDAASLNWTLCNCIDPLAVLKNIHKNLKSNGLLVVSESSRIMVPFKKPIYNFFNNKTKSENYHPWYFSLNSLSNILEISGFSVKKYNRFYDENDMVIIAQKKNKLYHTPKITFDNRNKVINFLKEWKRNSDSLKNKIF